MKSGQAHRWYAGLYPLHQERHADSRQYRDAAIVCTLRQPRDHFDPLLLYAEPHRVRKPMKQGRTDAALVGGEGHRKLLNACKAGIERSKECVTKSRLQRVVPCRSIVNIVLGFRSEDKRKRELVAKAARAFEPETNPGGKECLPAAVGAWSTPGYYGTRHGSWLGKSRQGSRPRPRETQGWVEMVSPGRVYGRLIRLAVA